MGSDSKYFEQHSGGQLQQATDNLGPVTTSVAVSVTVNAAVSPPPSPAAHSTIGRLAVVKDAAGAAATYYDKLGNPIQSDRKLTPAATWYSVKDTYDALDQVTSLTYPDNASIAYSYTSLIAVLELSDYCIVHVMVDF